MHIYNSMGAIAVNINSGAPGEWYINEYVTLGVKYTCVYYKKQYVSIIFNDVQQDQMGH